MTCPCFLQARGAPTSCRRPLYSAVPGEETAGVEGAVEDKAKAVSTTELPHTHTSDGCPQCRLVFGSLMEVRGDKYASVIDLANPDTTVVLHIYDDVSSVYVVMPA